MTLSICLSIIVAAAAPEAASRESAIRMLGSVSRPEDAEAARRALDAVTRGGADGLLPVLQGFSNATALGTNWLRNAFEILAAGEQRAGRKLPENELTAFILETDNPPAARRLAWEWLVRQHPDLKTSIIPQLLHDRHPDFRRDAVALLLEQAAAQSGPAAVALYRRALSGAVHPDQVKTIAEALAAAGEPVRIAEHFGFLTQWKIVGPFDNRDMKGFAVPYGPEAADGSAEPFDADARWEGLIGPVRWQDISTDDDYGLVDIAGQIENYKGSLMYAVTHFGCDKARSAELRLGTPNAWKLWVNGRLIFEREEYHRGTRMDQYRIPVRFRQGRNEILLKVCQNEQEQDWAQDYQFQLRVCDESGAAIHSVQETP